MPEENTAPKINPLSPPAGEAANHNAEIAAKQADQDLSGKSTAPEVLKETSEALDDLHKDAQKKAKEEADRAAAVVEPKPDDKTKEKPGAAKPAGEVKPGEAKPAGEGKSTVDEAAAKRAETLFKDSPGLPAGASPKSSEAFSAVKIRAAQEVSKLEQQVQALTKSNSELTEKLKNPVPENVTKELKELREFRSKLDVEIDPKFKEFDKSISSAQEFIYAQLKKSPAVTDDVIAQIKKHGGPENINLEKIFEVVKDPTIQRLVEAKVADIEQHKFNKDQAIKSAKDNIGQYLSEREKSFKEGVATHTTATRTEFDKLAGQLPWLKEQTPAAGADEAATKAVAEHNAFVADTRKQLDDALADDSPEMRAIMLTGMAQLFNLQRVHKAVSAENESLKTQLAESQALVERLKAPSRSRLPESGAPAGKVETPKPKDNFDLRAGDALDAIRNKVVEERSKVAAGV